MNTVTLIGNVGRAPEVRKTKSGTAVATLSVATTYLDQSKQEQTDWHNVVVWGEAAEEMSAINVGDRVIVVGQSRTRTWTDQSGQKRYTHEVVVAGFFNAIGLALRKPKPAQQRQSEQKPVDKTYDLDDEVPF